MKHFGGDYWLQRDPPFHMSAHLPQHEHSCVAKPTLSLNKTCDISITVTVWIYAQFIYVCNYDRYRSLHNQYFWIKTKHTQPRDASSDELMYRYKHKRWEVYCYRGLLVALRPTYDSPHKPVLKDTSLHNITIDYPSQLNVLT